MSDECQRGFLICGTGIGMSLAANKHPGIRAACCSDLYSAELTRRHNDTNVLCFGARVIDTDTALKLAEIFVTTDFECDEERHARRVGKMADLEKKYMKNEVLK
jgi:ribose 5-phosphate isomerase B